MSSPVAIATQLVEIVTGAPQQKVLGTQLADRLRHDTAFDPVIHGKLGAFVARHVPLVKRLERKGGDWYYGLAGPSADQDVLPFVENLPEPGLEESGALDRLSGPVWKTFVSPSTRHRLIGNPQTGRLAVISPGKPLPGLPWIPIPSCSANQHADIAKAFVAQLDDPASRSSLEEIIERAGSGPTSGFHEKVRELGLGRMWSPYRRNKIIEILASSLKSAGIEFREVAESERQQTTRPSSTRSQSEPAPPFSHGVIDIQKIASAAVGRMSESELRNLPIPLGYILDILVNR